MTVLLISAIAGDKKATHCLKWYERILNSCGVYTFIFDDVHPYYLLTKCFVSFIIRYVFKEPTVVMYYSHVLFETSVPMLRKK